MKDNRGLQRANVRAASPQANLGILRPSAEGLAGFLASATNIILTYPAFKTVFRAQAEGTSAARQVGQLAREGARNLYRGVTPPLLQRSLQVSVMFGANDALRSKAAFSTGLSYNSPGIALFAATGSGLLESVLTPFERVQSLMATRTTGFGVAAGGPRANPAPLFSVFSSTRQFKASGLQLQPSLRRRGAVADQASILRDQTGGRALIKGRRPPQAVGSSIHAMRSETRSCIQGFQGTVSIPSNARGSSSMPLPPSLAPLPSVPRVRPWQQQQQWPCLARISMPVANSPVPSRAGTLAVGAWILKNRGPGELYRGWQTIALRNVLSNAAFFGLRGGARDRAAEAMPWAPRWVCDFAGGGLLGAGISTALLPLATAKASIQMWVPGASHGGAREYLSPGRAVLALVEERGWRGLFRGAGLNFVRSAAGWGIMNSAYEAFHDQLLRSD